MPFPSRKTDGITAAPVSVPHQRIIANAIRQVRHCRSQPFSKSAEALPTPVLSASRAASHPSLLIASLPCDRSRRMPTQQKPSGGARLRPEALRDRQPEGADSALLQAGAPEDVSSQSSTAIAFCDVSIKTNLTHTHTRGLQLYCGPLWVKGFYCAVKSFFFPGQTMFSCFPVAPSSRV